VAARGPHDAGAATTGLIDDAAGAPVPLIYCAEIDPGGLAVIRLYLDSNHATLLHAPKIRAELLAASANPDPSPETTAAHA